MQLPKFQEEASTPNTPADIMNKRFIEAISKPVNRSVFGLLLFIRDKGYKSFTNLTKMTHQATGMGGRAETKPLPVTKSPIQDLYSKEEKTEDTEQNKSLNTLEEIDSKQEQNLEDLLKQAKKTNELLADIKDKKPEKDNKKQEKEKVASGSTGPGSMLKSGGQLLRTSGKLIPGKAGRMLKKLGAKSYGLGGKLNKLMGQPSGEEFVSDTSTAEGTTSLGTILGGKKQSTRVGRSRGVRRRGGRLGKLLGAVDIASTGLSLLGDSEDTEETRSTMGGVVDNVSTIADAVPATRGITNLGKKAAEKTIGKTGIKAVGKTASKIAGKVGLKAATKTAGKALGKSLLKKIPGVGLLAGLGFGFDRLMSGDVLGAVGEVASGAASTIPGVGTAVSTAIDAGLAAKDMMGSTGEEMPAQEELGDAISEQVEKSPEAKQIAATSEPEMSAPEQKQAIAQIQESENQKINYSNILMSGLKYATPLGLIDQDMKSVASYTNPQKETPKETSGSSFGSMIGSALKYTPMGMLGNAISGGMESLTGINPIKEIGSMLGITSPEQDAGKALKADSAEKAIPVKIVSSEMSHDMASQLKDATLKDTASSFGGSNTIINAPSSVSYQNNSAGENPSVPVENITMDDPYMMQAVRGNYSMAP